MCTRCACARESSGSLSPTGALEVEPGAAGGADLVLEADDDTLVGVLAGQLDPAALTVVEGDLSELGRFGEIFRFAEPQPAASR